MKFFHVVIALVLVTMLPLSAMASGIPFEPIEFPELHTEEFFSYDFASPAIDADLVVISQPHDFRAYSGDQVTLSFRVSGEVKRFIWYYRISDSGTWKFVDDGYDEETITFSFSEKMDGYQYMCRVADANGYYLNSNIITGHLLLPFDTSFTPGQILDFLNTGATASVSWFSSLMESTGAGTIYIAMMSVVLSVSILLGPLLGSARSGLSDVVHKPIKKKGDDK